MKKLIILLIIVIAAVLTNPTKAEYVPWAKSKAVIVTNGTTDRASAIVAKSIESSTTSESYVVFTLFETKVDDNNKITSVGLFHTFIPISFPTLSQQS